MLRSTVAASQSTSTPTDSRMSTAPQLEVKRASAVTGEARRPCAAAMIAAAELTLKVLSASIPVPEFSTSGPAAVDRGDAAGTVSNSTIACQAPAISSGVSPLATSAASSAPCCRSGCSPSST